MELSNKIKTLIKTKYDMDLVGIAPADALAEEPAGHRPAELLPGAKSIIVFGRSLADGAVQGAFRALESGKMAAQSSYAAYANDLAPNFLLVNAVFNLCCELEDTFGCVAMPCPFNVQQSMVWDHAAGNIFADPYGQGMPLNIYKAALAAGLGEFGWSGRFVTKEYGPRIMLCAVLTTLELNADRPYDGPQLCDPEKCGICAKLCPTGAIPSPCGGCTRTVSAGGKTQEIGDLNANACAVASLAFRKEFAGRSPVPDLITGNEPTDEEMAAAFAKKPLNGLAVEHYPRYLCDRCLLYCPLGNWKERFSDTGFSAFDPDSLKKTDESH